MALSDQLTDLANRTKQLEDAAATTRAKDRTKLEEQREKLQSKVKTEAQNIQSSAGKAQADAPAWWAGTTAGVGEPRAEGAKEKGQQRGAREPDAAERDPRR